MQKLLSWLLIKLLTLISKLPFSVLYFIANILEYLLRIVFPYRKQVIDNNLLRCFPEKTTTERKRIRVKFYHFFSRMIVETIKSYSISREFLSQKIVFTNAELLDKHWNEKQPVIIMMGHYGNWELIGLSAGVRRATNYSLYRTLKNKSMNEYIVNNRQRFGLKLLNEHRSLIELSKRLKEQAANMVVFIADQATKPKHGFSVTFFNQKTQFIKGPENLAKKFNCPVYFARVTIVNQCYHLTFEPISTSPNETNEGEITQVYASLLEHQIKENPAYWLWSHRKWKYES